MFRQLLTRLKRRIDNHRCGCWHHNRGLERFDRVLSAAALETLTDRIAERIAARGKATLLEIGCGEGRLLLDLLARFEDRIELHGINHERWPVIRNARALHASNVRYRVLPPPRLQQLGPPTVHLADGEDLSRFPIRDFDFVVSQVVLAHVARKDRVLEESARLLAPGGVFLHQIDHFDREVVDPGTADLPRFTIYDHEAPISTTVYLERHGIRVRLAKTAGFTTAVAEFRKDDSNLDLGLRFDEAATNDSRSLVTLASKPRLWGVRSVYRVDAP